MAKPDFPPIFFLKIFFGPPKGSLPEKNLPWGTKGKILEKKNFLENLDGPFRLVRNANRKNGLAFYFTPWEPRNLPRPLYPWAKGSSPFLLGFSDLYQDNQGCNEIKINPAHY